MVAPSTLLDSKGLPSTRSCSGRGRGGDLLFLAEHEQAPTCPVFDAERWSCHRRFVHTHTSPQLNLSPAREPRLVPVGWTVLVECVSAEGRDALRDGADGTRLEGRLPRRHGWHPWRGARLRTDQDS